MAEARCGAARGALAARVWRNRRAICGLRSRRGLHPGRRSGAGAELGLLKRRREGGSLSEWAERGRLAVPALLLAVGIAGPQPATAQISLQPSTASFGAVMGGQQAAIQQELHRNDWGRESPAVGRRGGPAPVPSARSADTRYLADPAVTARVQRQFIDFVRSRSGEAGG